jgi:hypothetical protein
LSLFNLSLGARSLLSQHGSKGQNNNKKKRQKSRPNVAFSSGHGQRPMVRWSGWSVRVGYPHINDPGAGCALLACCIFGAQDPTRAQQPTWRRSRGVESTDTRSVLFPYCPLQVVEAPTTELLHHACKLNYSHRLTGLTNYSLQSWYMLFSLPPCSTMSVLVARVWYPTGMSKEISCC